MYVYKTVFPQIMDHVNIYVNDETINMMQYHLSCTYHFDQSLLNDHKLCVSDINLEQNIKMKYYFKVLAHTGFFINMYTIFILKLAIGQITMLDTHINIDSQNKNYNMKYEYTVMCAFDFYGINNYKSLGHVHKSTCIYKFKDPFVLTSTLFLLIIMNVIDKILSCQIFIYTQFANKQKYAVQAANGIYKYTHIHTILKYNIVLNYTISAISKANHSLLDFHCNKLAIMNFMASNNFLIADFNHNNIIFAIINCVNLGNTVFQLYMPGYPLQNVE